MSNLERIIKSPDSKLNEDKVRKNNETINKNNKHHKPLYSSLQEAIDKSEMIADAYRFGQMAHKNDKRDSGEPYFEGHCEIVAHLIVKYSYYLTPKEQESAIAGAFVHDIKEDHKRTKNMIKEYLDDIYNLDTLNLSTIAVVMDKKNFPRTEEDALYVGKKNRIIGLLLVLDKLQNLHTVGYFKDLNKKKNFVVNVDKYIEIAKIHGFDDIVKELDKPWMEYVINGNPPLKGEGLPKYQSVKVPNRFNSI